MEVSSSRRDRFGHRKEGTGRTATTRVFDIRGRRTGWVPPSNVKKTEDGFDDVNAFFNLGAAQPPIPEDEPMPSKRIDFTAESRVVGSSPLPQPPQAYDDGVAHYGHADHGGDYDDYTAAAGSAVDEEDVRGFSKKKGRTTSKTSRVAKPKKAVTTAKPKPKEKPASLPPRSDSEREDDDDDEIIGASSSAYNRVRKSLGPLPDANDRYPQRRRWQRLDHFKGERIRYTESGAVAAEKLGVASPDIEAAHKRRTVSRSKSRDGGSRPHGGSGRKSSKRGRSVSRSRSASRSPERVSSRSRSRDVRRSAKISRRDESEDVARASHRFKGNSRAKSIDRGRSKDIDRGRSRDKEEVKPEKVSAEVKSKLKQLTTEVRGTRYQEPLSPARLPTGFHEAPSPTLVIAEQGGHAMYQIAVVRHYSQLVFEKLPLTKQSRGSVMEAADAAAAFDAPQFISGTVKLKARALKDEESTHNCTQVFMVLKCQPKSLQVDIAQQSYLLSPGDHFFVPQATLYRLINHSPDTEAEVGFVVIKPGAS